VVNLNPQRQKLIKSIYEALKNGEITRGNRLFSERELAEKFQVKRSILREALIALETLGIIDIRERQGMFISEGNMKTLAEGLEFLSHFSPIDILNQTFELRLMIETSAAELAAERRTERHISLLKIEIDFFEKLNATDHPSKDALGFQHNGILHNIIIEAADNMVLLQIYKSIHKLSQNAFSVLGSSELNFHPYKLWPDQLLEEHKSIVAAIISGNGAQAREYMRIHLENSQDRNERTIRIAQSALGNMQNT
jgi:GntR family transcriptional repressor for pyruvate dehydrogenase complex